MQADKRRETVKSLIRQGGTPTQIAAWLNVAERTIRRDMADQGLRTAGGTKPRMLHLDATRDMPIAKI